MALAGVDMKVVMLEGGVLLLAVWVLGEDEAKSQRLSRMNHIDVSRYVKRECREGRQRILR